MVVSTALSSVGLSTVFVYDLSESNIAGSEIRILPKILSAYMNFGCSIAISGNRVVVGADSKYGNE